MPHGLCEARTTAGMDEAPGRERPMASVQAVIVEAVPAVMQWPADLGNRCHVFMMAMKGLPYSCSRDLNRKWVSSVMQWPADLMARGDQGHHA